MKSAALCFGVLCLSFPSVSAQDLTDPATILAKCRAAYAGCATCTVEGRHRSDFKTAVPRTVAKDVHILFARSNSLFRLDWTETAHDGGLKTNSVFTRDGQTYFFWGSLGRYERPRDLQMALAKTTGISSSLAWFVPQMLLGKGGPLDLKNPVLRPEETLDGRLCYVVAGQAQAGERPCEVAVDKETFAVAREKDTMHITSHTSQEVADRVKKTNPKLAAEIAAQPPTPDFDVENVTDYKATFGAPVAAADCDYPVPAGMKLSDDR